MNKEEKRKWFNAVISQLDFIRKNLDKVMSIDIENIIEKDPFSENGWERIYWTGERKITFLLAGLDKGEKGTIKK